MNATHQTRCDRTKVRPGIIFLFGALLAGLLVPLGARAQLTIVDKADNSLSLDQALTDIQDIALNTTAGSGDELIFNGTLESFNQTISVGGGVWVGTLAVQNPQGAIFITGNATNAAAALTLGNLSVTGGGGIDMSNTSVNLSISAPVTLANSLTFTTSVNGTITVSGPINDNVLGVSQGYGITIGQSTTAGDVFLSGNNTFTGNLTLNAGTLYLSGNNSAGNGALVINSGVLENNSGNAIVLNIPVVIGTAGNATSGNFTFDTQGNSSIANASNSMVFNDGVTLAVNTTVTTSTNSGSYGGSGNLTFSNVTGPGNLTLKGAGPNQLVLVGTNNFGGGVNSVTPVLTISSGSVRLGSNGSVTGIPAEMGTIAGNINSAGALLIFNEPSNYTVTNNITGTGGVQQLSTNNTLTFGITETYSGTTTATGPIQLGYFGPNFSGNSAFGILTASNISIGNGSALTFAEPGSTTYNGTISGGNGGTSVTLTGAGVLANATYTTNQTGANNNLTFAANTSNASLVGGAGDNITVTYIYTGANAAEAVAVNGTAITVTLGATGGNTASVTTNLSGNKDITYTAVNAGAGAGNINIQYAQSSTSNITTASVSNGNIIVSLANATANATAQNVINAIMNNVQTNALVTATLAPGSAGNGTEVATTSNITLADTGPVITATTGPGAYVAGVNSTITSTANSIMADLNINSTANAVISTSLASSDGGVGTGALTFESSQRAGGHGESDGRHEPRHHADPGQFDEWEQLQWHDDHQRRHHRDGQLLGLGQFDAHI